MCAPSSTHDMVSLRKCEGVPGMVRRIRAGKARRSEVRHEKRHQGCGGTRSKEEKARID